jgi:hypothetical protein
MGNGAIGNGVKFKEFFKNVGTWITKGLTTVVDVAKKNIGTSGVKDA